MDIGAWSGVRETEIEIKQMPTRPQRIFPFRLSAGTHTHTHTAIDIHCRIYFYDKRSLPLRRNKTQRRRATQRGAWQSAPKVL